MIYKHTARTANDKNETVYAIGRTDELHGKGPEEGGYSIWVRKGNARGDVVGGIAYTWRRAAPKVQSKEGLSFVDAVKIINKKLKRKEFVEKLPK
tara:strand:+ start:417 stop:701 length:285 start_codon:yes stop_codon:yes gene_type:complete